MLEVILNDTLIIIFKRKHTSKTTHYKSITSLKSINSASQALLLKIVKHLKCSVPLKITFN